jgi:hypothetical protein
MNKERIERALQNTISGLIELQSALGEMWEETEMTLSHLETETHKTQVATRNALANALSIFENEIK